MARIMRIMQSTYTFNPCRGVQAREYGMEAQSKEAGTAAAAAAEPRSSKRTSSSSSGDSKEEASAESPSSIRVLVTGASG